MSTATPDLAAALARVRALILWAEARDGMIPVTLLRAAVKTNPGAEVVS